MTNAFCCKGMNKTNSRANYSCSFNLQREVEKTDYKKTHYEMLTLETLRAGDTAIEFLVIRAAGDLAVLLGAC